MQWIEGSERTESAAGRRQFSAPTYRTEQRKARKFWRARDQGAPRNILSGMQFDPDKEDLTASKVWDEVSHSNCGRNTSPSRGGHAHDIIVSSLDRVASAVLVDPGHVLASSAQCGYFLPSQ